MESLLFFNATTILRYLDLRYPSALDAIMADLVYTQHLLFQSILLQVS